jgi:hypothetical protein
LNENFCAFHGWLIQKKTPADYAFSADPGRHGLVYNFVLAESRLIRKSCQALFLRL